MDHFAWALLLMSSALVAFILIAQQLRKVRILLRIGSFPCWVKTPGSAAWRPGIATYHTESLHWFAVRSLSPRPTYVWDRHSLELEAANTEADPETGALPGTTDVSIRLRNADDKAFDLALAQDARTGLSSWLEGRPPRNVATF